MAEAADQLDVASDGVQGIPANSAGAVPVLRKESDAIQEVFHEGFLAGLWLCDGLRFGEVKRT